MATPLTLKLAPKYCLDYRGYEEKRAAELIDLYSGGRDEVSKEEVAFLGKEADNLLSKPDETIDSLIKKHELEDVRNISPISRGGRRIRR